MSDSPWDDADPDDLDFMQEDPDILTPEEAFKMVTINHKKGPTVKVELEDKNGEPISLGDVVEDLLEYMNEKNKENDGDNQFMNQILPLVAQGSISTIGRTAGLQNTAIYLSNPVLRGSFISAMAVGFLLLKYVQQNNLTIKTYEEKLSEEEIEALIKKTQLSSAATIAALSGLNPNEFLEMLVEKGMIDKEDVKNLFQEDEEDEEDEE